MKRRGRPRVIHFGWTKSLLFHHPAVSVYNDPVYNSAVTAQRRGLTQNRLQLQALCKTSVFPPPIAGYDLIQEWQSQDEECFILQFSVSVGLQKNL